MSAVSYRPDIQGLRAIAVLAVMAFHFNSDWMPGGFVGVDVFLVISGFLITSILLKKKSQSEHSLGSTIKYFYLSRLRRIAPAYFVMLVVVALTAAVFFIPKDFETFKDGLEKAAWFNSNNYFADFGDYFAPANHEQPLLHTWSLAVELQFYLLAPFLILLLPVRLLKLALVVLLLTLTLLAEYRLRFLGIEQATYYSLYARLPEFFAGCLVAAHLSTVSKASRGSPWLANLGLTLILVSVVAQPVLGHFPGVPALLPVIGSVMLLMNIGPSAARGLLSHRYLVWIGALSYSLYLWHWPVLAFLRYYSGAEVLDLSLGLLFVALTLLLSLASYYWIELPLRSSRGIRLQRVGYAMLLLSVIGTSQSMGAVNEAFTPQQLPIEYQRYADLDTICHGKVVGDCLRGDLGSDKEVLMLGDSHAAMLNHFFDYLGGELGFKARVITASSCVTIPKFNYQRISEWAHQPCSSQIARAAPLIESSTVIVIAGKWSYHVRSEGFDRTLIDFIITNSEKKIYIVGQVPKFRQDVVRAQRFVQFALPIRSAIDKSYLSANEEIYNISIAYDNVKFLQMDDLPMFDEAPLDESGRLLYRDSHHLNEVGARALAKEAEKIFSKILVLN